MKRTLIVLVVAMMFAPGWRNTMMGTPGLPFTSPRVRMSSTDSVTFATFDKGMAAPFL